MTENHYICLWCPFDKLCEDFEAQEHLSEAHDEICFKEDLPLFYTIDGRKALYSKEMLDK